ncbi:putative TonB protein [Nitrospira japonica]|uniref:Putative TonB protein n=1 Tax=Nitrospira japonica TaxID=1325564 RepID=A0A1W1I485_9BACT|nr:energy transducer TonB [Nitrospira japonica]SLM47812.1 putative TonB protein [Nitrospira japonica]
MTSTHDNRFHISGWGASLVLHAVVVALTLVFLARIDPVLKKETFRWEVALVEAPAPTPVPATPQSVAPPVQPKTRPAHVQPAPAPTPETPVQRVAPQESVQMVHPVVETPRPVEQKIEPLPQQKPEPVERQVEAVQHKAEPVIQKVEESPAVEPTVHAVETKSAEPVYAETVVAQHRPAVPVEAPAPAPTVQEVAVASPSPAAAADNPPTSAAEATQQPSTPAAASEQVDVAPASAPVETPRVVAKAATGMPETKADHRWLAESLWRRVAELKRYPHSARMNGLQGKVVLKAVIRSDGHLAEVSVQKSSGHSVLDTAAMEAVKLACPLHMKHELGKPQIVVSLPIVYSLAN